MDDSLFHSSEVNQMGTKKSGDLVVKSKVSSLSGSTALRQMNPVHIKES